jgi:acetyltransferase-like isoleucine patch superfamily enzyme
MVWGFPIRISNVKELYAVYLGYSPGSFWAYLKESAIEGLLGWVPGILGVVLRGLGYRLILKKMGSFSMILKGVDLRGCPSISLDERVKLRKFMSIRVFYSHNSIQLGRNCSVHEYTIIKSKGGNVLIGENTFISSFVNISAVGNVHIGRNVMLANGCRIETGTHGFTDLEHPMKEQPAKSCGIRIEDDCWLGAGVKVLDNVRIGHGSVIGAGSVVTKDLPPYSIAAGVPARLIKKRRTIDEASL